MTEQELLSQIADAQREIDRAYWLFTRTKRGVPPSSAVPDAYVRKSEAKQKLRELRANLRTASQSGKLSQRSGRP